MDQIFDDYYNKLYYWSIKKTKNIADAQDLVNDIFVGIITYYNQNIEIKKLDNLIWKIAYNCWCKKAKKYILDKSLLNDDEVLNNIEVSENYIDKIIYQDIISNLSKYGLSKIEIECFKLYYQEDLSIAEISKKINVSGSNIKFYLYNARKKIKEEYYE